VDINIKRYNLCAIHVGDEDNDKNGEWVKFSDVEKWAEQFQVKKTKTSLPAQQDVYNFVKKWFDDIPVFMKPNPAEIVKTTYNYIEGIIRKQ
jgi:hypothetical protein